MYVNKGAIEGTSRADINQIKRTQCRARRPIRKGGHCPIEVTYLNGELEGEALDDLGREEVPQDEVAVLVAGDDVVPSGGDGGDAVAHGAGGRNQGGLVN